ncbi:MAG: oxidoreductase [Verrucomicrobia bacterium A1]|nr:MAG: oxidoreductase [Verrucomicrobia bacterium A1]
MTQTLTAEVKPDIYLPEPATVVRSEAVTKMERFLEFKLDSGRPLGHMPGQFAEVSLPGIGEAPISISSAPAKDGSFQMVVRRAGNVSGAMHGLNPGDRVGIRGPFGTHFPVEDQMQGKNVLFVCGGIGLVPVRSAIQYVLERRKEYGHVMILVGMKTPADRLFVDELAVWRKARNVTLLQTVDRRDESWSGPEGVITTLMPLVKFDPANTVALICGPPIMYKFVIVELGKMKLADDRIYLSLERRMKCGVGKCGHCQVNGLYCCQDGPVFPFSDLNDVEEAI